MVIIVEALDGCLLNGAVHALYLTICPRMLHFGQSMFDAILVANPIKDVAQIIDVTSTIGKLDAIVHCPAGECLHSLREGQYDMDFVGNNLGQIAQELGGGHLTCLLVQFDIGKL